VISPGEGRSPWELEWNIIEIWFGLESSLPMRAFVLLATAVTGPVQEPYIVSNYLGCFASDAILIIVGADLQPPFHCHQSALKQVIGASFG